MTQRQVTYAAWFSCFWLCISHQACIAPDPLLVGWQCTQTPECGSAASYVCHRQRCRLSCTKDADCGPQQSCITDDGNRFCSTQANAETPGEASTEASTEASAETPNEAPGAEVTTEPGAEMATEATGDRATEPVMDAAAPDVPTAESPPQDSKGCTPATAQACYTGPANTRHVGACQDGEQICQPDGTWGVCTGETLPTTEICDELDNNCDGQIDEGIADLGKACTKGIGECQTKGKNVCGIDGKSLICDAQVSPPRAELCDGKDNDCNGKIDEDFPDLGKSCNSQGPGACQRQGKLVCATGGGSVVCDAIDGQPSPELCNGIDDDCDGKIDNISGGTNPIQRSCYTGSTNTQNIGACKDGIQQCSGGLWASACIGEVTPTAKDTCTGQDDDCNGIADEGCICVTGQTRFCGSDTGECKKGTQTCINNAWDPCTGEVKPRQEICDNKDNDCDGQIDEDYPDKGNPCSVGIGECQTTGKFVCKTTQDGTQCDAAPRQPSPEQCDGKDNNCNGQIDEGNPESNQLCTTTQSGECASGTSSCQQGKLVCVAKVQPITEICRNNKDDDCDGQIDDICGPPYPYVVTYSSINSGTNFVKRADNSDAQFGFDNIARLGTGKYRLKPSSSAGFGCNAHPIFLNTYSHFKRAIAYHCDKNNTSQYQIHSSTRILFTSGSTLQRGDNSFSGVVPNQPDDVWATVQTGSCSSSACTTSTKQGAITVSRSGQGVYKITSSRCSSTTSPIFTSVWADEPAGWITAKSLGNGTCELRTFDPTNNLTNNIDFAVWLPNPSKVAWASITPSQNQQQPAATINASNFFSDQSARWSGTQATFSTATCPPFFNRSCSRTKTAFPAWRSPSAVLLQYQSSNATMGTSNAILYNSSQEVYVSSFVGNDTSVTDGTYHIMFVQ